jgi:glycosyltransferase involved in cell wall biosynthesis
MSEAGSQPLVSCVMPTANRRSCVALAIRCFQTQDYQNKELVILDDGAESIADLIPPDPQIRYRRVPRFATLGDKRNECVIASRGDLIMHWDDDDWMAPHRISYQVHALLRERAEVCGLQRMLFCKQDTGEVWLYEYPDNQRPWLAGGSLLYTRDFWRRSPFPSIQVASDTRFVWDRQMKRRIALPDYTFYVAMIHAGNTSPKNCTGPYWARWTGDLREVMGDELSVYCSAAPSESSAQEPLCLQQMDAAQIAIGGSAELPFVSCLLLTRDRPDFARQVIRCFLRQTYEPCELIVLDDGERSVADLCQGLFRVRHLRLARPASLDQRLESGISQARGELIQQFDDSAYYHPDFLKHMISYVPAEGSERTLIACGAHLILLPGQTQVRVSREPAGNTLCFHRRLWEQAALRQALALGDIAAIAERERVIRVNGPELYLQLRYCSVSRLGGSAEADLTRLPVYHKPLDDLILPIDRLFYRSLVNGAV